MTLDFNVVQVNFSVWKDLWKDNAGPIYTQLKCVFPFESAPIPSWPSEQLELNVGCCAERISIALLWSHLKSAAWTNWPSESWLLCKGESINAIFRFHKHNYATAVQRFHRAHVGCTACLPCNVNGTHVIKCQKYKKYVYKIRPRDVFTNANFCAWGCLRRCVL